MSLHDYIHHPHLEHRKTRGPVKVADQHAGESTYSRFNTRVAVGTTGFVGSMNCAWLFLAISLVSLPAALRTGDVIVIVSWVAQTCLQLVLLSVIMVGQNVQAAAADKRAESTYADAEAVLHETGQVQQHLEAQDAHLIAQDDKLTALVAQVDQVVAHLTPPPVA